MNTPNAAQTPTVPFDPANKNKILYAAHKGDVAMLRPLLIPSTDKTYNKVLLQALQSATLNNQPTAVDMLAPLVKDTKESFGALCLAAEEGRVECLNALLVIPFKSKNIKKALHTAAIYGRDACVDILLPLCGGDLSEAYLAAARFEEFSCAERLFAHCTDNNIAQAIALLGPVKSNTLEYINTKIAQRMHEKIAHHINTTISPHMPQKLNSPARKI